MGFLDGLADFIDYMMFGENSKSAARMRAEREKYEREAQARFEREQATNAAAKKAKVRNWDKEPTLGSVNGEHEVYFKTSRDGQTLIADAKHGPDKFDRQYGDPNSGKHDHFGNGKGKGSNGTRRGFYTGPGK